MPAAAPRRAAITARTALDQLRLGDGDLRLGAHFQIVGAVLVGLGEFGAEREIADHDLRAARRVALVRALDDGAERAALVGVFELRVHLAFAEIELGGDAGVAQRCDEPLVVGHAVAVHRQHDDRAGRSRLPRRWAS